MELEAVLENVTTVAAAEVDLAGRTLSRSGTLSLSSPADLGSEENLWAARELIVQGMRKLRLLDPAKVQSGRLVVEGVEGEGRYFVFRTPEPLNWGAFFTRTRTGREPLTGPEDILIQGFIREFEADIVLHAGSQFQFLRVNLRRVAEPQKDFIRDQLLRAFESQFVTTELTEATIANLKTAFIRRWDSGDIVTFH